MAGRFACGPALAGCQTFRYRQSSEGDGSPLAPAGGGGPNWPCMQLAPNVDASRTPSHGATGRGGLHLSSPTGGAAKGMPLNDTTPSSTTPCTWPLSTRTTTAVCAGPLPATISRPHSSPHKATNLFPSPCISAPLTRASPASFPTGTLTSIPPPARYSSPRTGSVCSLGLPLPEGV